jgi:WD40 repeat protein
MSLQDGGHLAAVVTDKGSARVLDLVTGEVVADLDRPGGITVAEFSPRGDFLVAGGDGDAYIWDARSWKLRKTLEGHASTVTDVAFTTPTPTDNLRVMTTSTDTTARLWDLATGAPSSIFTGWHTEAVVSGDASSRNDQWVTASNDETVGIWTELFTEPIVLSGHGGRVTDAAFSGDGWHVLTASEDGNARLWRARDPNLEELANQGGERTTRGAFSPSGDRLVTVTAAGIGRLYDSGGRVLKMLPSLGTVRDIAFSGSGWFATGGDDGIARLFRPDGTQHSTLTHGSPIRVVAMTQDGGLVATGGPDGRVVVFRRSGKVVKELVQGAAVTSVEFRSPETLASGGADGSVKVWNLRGDVADRSLVPHQRAVTDLAFSPGGLLASASDDKTAHVYDVRTGNLVRQPLQGHPAAVNVVEFSPNGRLLVTASTDGEVRRWSTTTWQPIVFRGRRPPEIGGHHIGVINEVRFSRDSRWVLTAGPSAAGVWHARTGDLLYFVRGHRIPIRSITFAPKSWRVLTGGSDGTLRAWDCRLCGELPELQKLARARLHLAERGRR